jgi:inorganic pyrophosphatase
VNYGYIDGTRAPDGEGIDAYILGISESLTMFDGICIAVIHRIDDDDDKLIVVPEGMYFDDEKIDSMTDFQERFFESVILR